MFTITYMDFQCNYFTHLLTELTKVLRSRYHETSYIILNKCAIQIYISPMPYNKISNFLSFMSNVH